MLFSSSNPEKPPLAGIRVLSRDTEGKNEQWLTTDSIGKVGLELTNGPTILVVPVDGEVHTFVLLDDCKAILFHSNRGIFSPRSLTA